MNNTEHDIELLLKYPTICCRIQDKKKHYTGRVLYRNRDIDLHIIEERNHENVHFNVKTSLGNKFDESINDIASKNITELLDKLLIVLEHKINTKSQLKENLTFAYKRILQEYAEFTGFHLTIKKCQISSDLTNINVQCLDDGGREHSLQILVKLDEPRDMFVPIHLNLPEQFVKDFPKKFSYISEAYSKFVAVVENLQLFFNLMDDLDRNCSILDPEQPTRQDCYRRIWLDENISVIVIVNPLNIKTMPELKFLGAERIVEQYHQKLSGKLEIWDSTLDFLDCLLNLLELESFPQKPKYEKLTLMEVGECSICYSLRFNEKLPEVICNNKSCNNCYHLECLYEWLTSINSKRIFNQLHGLCPNCEKKIVCPITEMG